MQNKSFQIVSDLHIESGNPNALNVIRDIEALTPILIIAGDMGSFHTLDPMINGLKEAARKFKHVLYVPGNHEYYYKSASQKYSSMGGLLYEFKRQLSTHKELKNVQVLERKIVNINGITFAGATLWSDIEREKALPDYMRLSSGPRSGDVSSMEYQAMHRRDTKWLHRVAKMNIDGPLVVITHHAPSKSLLLPSRFVRKYASFYATNLENTPIFKKADVWVFGHTHHNVDRNIGSTRVVSNQLGKKNDSCAIDLKKIVVIK
jgi:predicted phosphodiesterase